MTNSELGGINGRLDRSETDVRDLQLELGADRKSLNGMVPTGD